MSYPLISVIIPSYNQGEFIEETLLSVLGQQYPNLEILVIDGGSTDQTVEILDRYSSHLAYWHSKPDKGQADAINQGFRLSTGEIVCWLNSDDMYLPGTLLDVARRFKERTHENYLIYGNTVLLHQKGEQQQSGSFKVSEAFDPVLLTYYDFIFQPSSFWTRQLWQQTGELNLEYHYVLDWDWYIRASKIAQFEYIPKFYSVYRIHELHKTGTGGNQRAQEIYQIAQTYASDYWINLYAEVERSYAKIRQFVQHFRIPSRYRHHILPLFFPRLNHKLQTSKDLSRVLEMLG